MSSTLPISRPTPDTQEWFDRIDREEFTLPLCGACSTHFLYPRMVCPHCGSREVALVPASGRGAVASFVVSHRAPHGFDRETPYVVAEIDLEEGPRMMGNVIGLAPDALVVDQAVRVVFEPRGERRVVQFEVAHQGQEESA